MTTFDFGRLLYEKHNSSIEKDKERAHKEILKCEQQLINDLNENKYIINNGLGQIRGGMNFPKAVFEEEKPEIIIIEGDVLEERLKNPFFLAPLAEFVINLNNSKQKWIKTSIHKKNSLSYLGASLLINENIYNYTNNNKEFTPFESVWYSSLDRGLMNIMGFPGYERTITKEETMFRLGELSNTIKIGTLSQVPRYKEFRPYQQTPIEESIAQIEFKEKYGKIFKKTNNK